MVNHRKIAGKSSLHVEVKTVIYPSRVGCTLPTLTLFALDFVLILIKICALRNTVREMRFSEVFRDFVNTSSRLNPGETALLKASDTPILSFPRITGAFRLNTDILPCFHFNIPAYLSTGYWGIFRRRA